MSKLNQNFILELFKLLFKKREVLDICLKHLEFYYIPSEEHKYIWKSISTYYKTTNKIPTIGLIAQSHERRQNVLGELEKIRDLDIPDVEETISQLELFIKEAITVEAYNKFSLLYNQGEQEKAFILWTETGEKITNFSLKKDSIYYEKVFGDYNKRKINRKIRRQTGDIIEKKIPFSICELDRIFKGGCDKKDTFLFLSQSGVGKTKLLRWIGVGAARRGFRVLHIQLEGSKEECVNGYDATWSGQLLYELENGYINKELEPKISKIVEHIIFNKGEIYVYAPEKFDTTSLREIRNIVIEMIKLYGTIDLLLIDYYELIEPGDGKIYRINEERQRREAISKSMKNLAVEFDMVAGTCTAASTVDIKDLDDPDFVQTRYDISEFKGALKPFSYFITLNQTRDEYFNNFLRFYCDKIRKYKGKQIIEIYQNYEYEKFYDKQKTIRYQLEKYENNKK